MTKPKSKKRVASYTVREIKKAYMHDLIWHEMNMSVYRCPDFGQLSIQLRKNRAKKKGMKR